MSGDSVHRSKCPQRCTLFLGIDLNYWYRFDFFVGRDAGIVGGYVLVNPPFLVVPGAVAIEQILSIVHVNYAILFIGVVIAG